MPNTDADKKWAPVQLRCSMKKLPLNALRIMLINLLNDHRQKIYVSECLGKLFIWQTI